MKLGMTPSGGIIEGVLASISGVIGGIPDMLAGGVRRYEWGCRFTVHEGNEAEFREVTSGSLGER